MQPDRIVLDAPAAWSFAAVAGEIDGYRLGKSQALHVPTIGVAPCPMHEDHA
jgi:hypothetical protein